MLKQAKKAKFLRVFCGFVALAMLLGSFPAHAVQADAGLIEDIADAIVEVDDVALADEAVAEVQQETEAVAANAPIATADVMDDMPVGYVRPHGFDVGDVSGWENRSSIGGFVTQPSIVTIDDTAWFHYSTTYAATNHALNVVDASSPMVADGQISYIWRADPETGAGTAAGTYNFAFGALVRYVDEDNYLHIQYTDANFALEWRNGGTGAWTATSLPAPALLPGSENMVVAQFVGQSVTIYLNGELIGTLTDARIPTAAGQFGFRNHNVSVNRTRNVYVRDIAYTNLDMSAATFGAYYIRNHSETVAQARGGFSALEEVDPTQVLWDIRRGNAINEPYSPVIDQTNGNITMVPSGGSHQNFVLLDGPEFLNGTFEFVWTPSSTTQVGGAHPGTNHSIGFLLRYVDEDNFVMAQIGPTSQWHVEGPGGWTGMVDGGVVFQTGQEYRIRVSIDGNQISVSIDGGEPFDLPSAGWFPTAPGRVGFRRHNNWSPNVTVRDIRIMPADGTHAGQTITYGLGRTVDSGSADITIDQVAQTMTITDGIVYDAGAMAATQQGLAFEFTPTAENMTVTALLRYVDDHDVARVTLANGDNGVVATLSGARNGRILPPIELGASDAPFVAGETYAIKVILVNNAIWVFQDGEQIAYTRLPDAEAPTMVAGRYGFVGPAILSNIAYLVYDVAILREGEAPEPIPVTITGDDMIVTLNQNFPSVIQYEMRASGNVMEAQTSGVNVVSIGLMRENLHHVNRAPTDFIPRDVTFEAGETADYARYTLYIANEDGTGAPDGSDDIFEIVVEYRVEGTILHIDTLEIRELQAPKVPMDVVLNEYPTYNSEGYLIGGPRLKSIAFPGNATASVTPAEADAAQIAAYWSALGGYVSGGMLSRGANNWNTQDDVILDLMTGMNITRSSLPWATGNQTRTDRWPAGGTNTYLARNLATPIPMTVADRSRDVSIAILSNGDISATMINNRSSEVLRFTYDVTVIGGEVMRGEIGDGRHFWRHEPTNAQGGMRNVLGQTGIMSTTLNVNWALLQDHLPLTQVVLTEDINGDGVADWQDGAVAYRRALTTAQERYRGLTTHPIYSELNRNSVMWCSMNIVSGTGNPFLRTIDITKNLYNLFDGFGQRLYHKGYQAEGHDDNHPDYGNQFGPRQGGLEDFNLMIDVAGEHNAVVGVHLNAQHPNADAFYVDPRIHNGRNWWGWVDSSPGISTEMDVLSGQLFARLAELDQAAPNLHFIYLDVYSESDWVGRHVMHTFEHFGWQILTEFGGPMRSFVSGMHWGIDTGYPSQSHNGTTSQIMRFIFNDGQDSFEPERLLRGAMMPRIGAWRGHNYNESVRLFHGVNLPSRFLQQYELMYWNPNDGVARFTHGVESRRVGDRTHITKGNMLIADLPYNITYNADGNGMTAAAPGTPAWTGFVSNARVFVPWTLDVDLYGEGYCPETTVFERAYVYLDAGGNATWTVPANWSQGVRLYELTTQGRELVTTIPIVGGQITVTDLKAQTGYVVYPQGTTPAVQAVTEFGLTGNRTMVRDGNFDTENFTHWQVSSTSGDTSHVRMSNDRQPSVPGTGTRGDSLDLNHLFVDGDSPDARIYQTIEVDPGEFYIASVWARIGGQNNNQARRVTIQVEDMAGNVLGENFIMRNVQPMRLDEHPFTHHWINAVRVQFEVPEGVTQVRYVLKVDATTDPAASVYFNWATMRQFFSTDANDYSYIFGEDSDIVFFEDFENVDEYWGAFFQGGTGTQTGSHGHLTQRFNPDTDTRRWFTPPGGVNPFGITEWNVPVAFTHTVGNQTFEMPGGDTAFQPLSYVINDTWSFRQHDSGTGRRLRTLPQTLRLEEDTTYKLSFYYRAYHRTDAIDREAPYFSVQVRANQAGGPFIELVNQPLANTPKNFSNTQDGYYFQENMPDAVRVEIIFETGTYRSMDDPLDGDIYLAFYSHLGGETVLMLDDVMIEIWDDEIPYPEPPPVPDVDLTRTFPTRVRADSWATNEGAAGGEYWRVLDDDGTHWHSRWGAGGGRPVPVAAPHYLEIDFGEEVTLTSIELDRRTTGGNNGVILAGNVFRHNSTENTWPGGNDFLPNSEWDMVRALPTFAGAGSVPGTVTVTFDSPVTTRFLRIEVTSGVGGYASLARFRAFGAENVPVAVSATDVTTVIGRLPVMPATFLMEFEDGNTAQHAANWTQILPRQVAVAGTFTVVANTGIKGHAGLEQVTSTVTVLPWFDPDVAPVISGDTAAVTLQDILRNTPVTAGTFVVEVFENDTWVSIPFGYTWNSATGVAHFTIENRTQREAIRVRNVFSGEELEIDTAPVPLFTIQPVTGSPGQLVNVEIWVSDTGDAGIVSGGISLAFDPAVLEPVNNGDGRASVTVANAGLAVPVPPLLTNNPLRLDVAAINQNADVALTDGLFLTVAFRVRDDAPLGSSALTLSEDAFLSVADGGSAVMTAVDNADATITVSPPATYTVTRADASTVPATNMSITPAEPQIVGTVMTVTVTPPEGQRIVADSLVITGVADITLTATGATFPMPVGGGEIVVNATFEPIQYDVTFNLQGGAVDGNTANVVVPTAWGTAPIAPTPTRAGYDLLGWSLTADGAIVNPLPTITGVITYHAVWEVRSYDVTFNLQGGAVDGNTANVVVPTAWGTAPVAPTPTRVGYDLLGWSLTADGAIVNPLPTITGAIIYHAVWEVRSYDVTFNLQGGAVDGNTANVVVPTAWGTAPVAPTPTRVGYDFLGWSLTAGGAIVNPLPTITGAIIYHAVWEEDVPPLNTEALEDLIAEVEALVEADFTPETWAVLEDALAAAEYALANATTQDEINEAYDNLRDAIEALVERRDPPAPPIITTTTLPGGTVDRAYNATLAATGDAPITWAVTTGTLPTGLTLNPATGAITGTPTTAGTFAFTVTATNAGGNATRAFTIVIVEAEVDAPNRDALRDAIADAEEVGDTQGAYSDDSWAAFVDARDRAQAVFDDPASTQDEIDKAVAELLEAIAGLREFHARYMFGDTRGEFRPGGDITRAEAAAILARVMIDDFDSSVDREEYALPAGMDSFDAFPDVAANNWFYHYVAWVSHEGLVEGDDQGNFRPNAPISRQELAMMIARIDGVAETAGETSFRDAADIAGWARAAVYTVYRDGLMQGDAQGNFRPRANITRAEVATVINRILGRLDSRDAYDAADVERDNARVFPDVDADANPMRWYFPSVLAAANDHYLTRDDDGNIAWVHVRVQLQGDA